MKAQQILTMDEMVAAVRAHVMAYNGRFTGWEFLTECWSDAEIAEELAEARVRSASGAINTMFYIVRDHDDHRKEIESTVW